MVSPKRWYLLAPICIMGMCVEFLNFIFYLTKPISIPECPSALALWKLPHREFPSYLWWPRSAWPLLFRISSPRTQQEKGRGKEDRRLCFVSNKKHNLVFFTKSKKETKKGCQSLNSEICYIILFTLNLCYIAQVLK